MKTKKATSKTKSAEPKSEASKDATPNGLLNHSLGRLFGVMKRHGAEATTEDERNFCITAFAQLAPRNTAEVLLIQQMIACHEVGLNMLTRAKHTPSAAEVQEAGNLAAKLLGLFERQFTALTKARKPPQVVTVEHVHRHLHVSTPGPTGEATIIQGQPHATTDARTLAIAPGPALLSQDAPRDTLPVASNEARTLPHARRRTRDRRTER